MAVGIGGATAVGAAAESKGKKPSPGHRRPRPECVELSPEQVEGPYFLDYALFRKDITEDEAGVPLRLRIKVIDSVTCEPLRNAAVDVWHCNAIGLYSGYTAMGSGGGGGGGGTPPTGPPPTGTPTGPPPGGGGGGHAAPTDDLTFLRGSQVTDHHGEVEFRTVYPGWYQGRAVHIHLKVVAEGQKTADGYEGGHQCHTGQFYFSEESALEIAALDPYKTNTTTRVTLDEDSIYPGTGLLGGLLPLHYRKGHIALGVRSSITVGVDPDAVNGGSGTPPQASATPSASAS
ncbi:intradiol ring-cleavage dioxygenase [Actinacidiphila oryziradicis]|uniref:intradiol ring-cleavage dioxygenase n=1 Tax=Actinacidiphila oryziradicis TaxID=2571141 RepID=UPI003211E9BC